MKSPKLLKALGLAHLRHSSRAPDENSDLGAAPDQAANAGPSVSGTVGFPAFKTALTKIVPALAGSARETAGQLRDQVKALDLRERVNTLKRAHGTAAGPSAVVIQPVTPPRPRVRASSDRSWGKWTFLLGCLTAAGVAHIVTIFALPIVGTTSAFERLKPLLQVNAMSVLPPAAPGGTHIPFLSPDMRYAMCRYDISSGPVGVIATLPEAGWSLAIHAPDGENFYLVPGQDQRRTEIAFTITRTSERPLIATPGVRRSDVDATQVTSPRPEGLVVLRAPVRGTAYRAETEAILKAATCRPIVR
jgi:uncharacterized membrane protein